MELRNLPGWSVEQKSVVEMDGTTYFLAQDETGAKHLGVVGDWDGFEGTPHGPIDALLCPLTPQNASTLRDRLAWLRPVPLGLQTSAGFGDRLGLATPGHVGAARQFSQIAPIFAQQSVRENARTGRTPQQVMDDAMWGVFRAGWQAPWGADADHLKTPDDADAFVAAGYTFFTIDPGDHVGDWGLGIGDWASLDLPWNVLEDSAEGMWDRYLGRAFQIEDFTLTFDETTLARAAAKYGRAIAHTARMYRHLAGQLDQADFELEVSVDETETPTSPEEHYFIASELRRLGVRWVSLAPRFIGRFEKGVDYIGDLNVFEAALVKHAAIARTLGPYKLSIHSGSDKFGIYPLIAKHTQGLVHLKTAGTSYLEALRAVARVQPDFFRQILTLARQRYETDRATYHVSAQLSKVPTPESLSDGELPSLLDQFDARQALHVTFGSVLDRFGERLGTTLQANEEIYAELLETHFGRHLSPFVRRN